jgi:hypothetical protein
MPRDKRALQIVGVATIAAAAVLGWLNLAFRIGDRGQWYYPVETALLLGFTGIQLQIIRRNNRAR